MRWMTLLCLSAAACAAPADTPSLLPRPIERAGLVEPQPATRIMKPIEDALAARIAEIVARARAGDVAFRIALAQNQGALSKTGPEGSEAWIAAQQARSALEAARQPAADALAEIDAFRIDHATQAANDDRLGGTVEIAAAQAEIAAIVERETASITH